MHSILAQMAPHNKVSKHDIPWSLTGFIPKHSQSSLLNYLF